MDGDVPASDNISSAQTWMDISRLGSTNTDGRVPTSHQK